MPVLGSAPTPIQARRDTAAQTSAASQTAGWTAARIPTMRTAPRTLRDFYLESALESNRTAPTDAGSNREPTTRVFTQELACGGMRSLTKCA
jgi:hypothetical protein